MSFIRDLAKKLAGTEPAHWSVDKFSRSAKDDDEKDVIEVQIVYRLTDEQAAMLHVIDEAEDDMDKGAGQ